MKINFKEGFFAVFSTFWVVILILDYLDKHPIYQISLEHYKYTGLTFFWLLMAIPFSLYYSKSLFFKPVKRPFLNGLMIFGIILTIILSTTFAFNQYILADLDFSHYSHVLIRSSYTLLCGTLVILGAYSCGNLVLHKLTNQIGINGISRFLIELSIGFAIIIFGLFLLGSFGLLQQWIVIIWLLLFTIINYRTSLNVIKTAFWSRIELPSQWNFWGYLILFLILIYSSINFLYTQAPFPLGFDARNYYVNISKLIADSEAIISGFQPYAWSLLDSVGYIAFLSPEVTLLLSTIGGFFTMIGMYEIGNKYLKLNPNYLLLACFLFMSTPAVTNHWIVEFKVDLALLFVQCSILCLLFHWLTVMKSKGEPLLSNRQDWAVLIVLSVLLGFSLSIKVLSVFLVFGVFLVLWWYSKDVIGMIGIASIAFSILILMGLDGISGLRQYHSNPNISAGLFSIFGLGLLLLSLVKNKKRFIRNSVVLIVSGVIMVFTFSPWMVKNYTNSNGKTSIMKIVMGESPKPPIDVNTIKRNYNKKYYPNKK